MKSCIKDLSSVWITNRRPQFSQTKRWLHCSIVILCAVSFNSCFLHYYKTNSIAKTDIAGIQKLIDSGRYFILHAHNQNFAMTRVKINNENLEGEIGYLPEEHLQNLHPKNTFANRFKPGNKDFVLSEVHLYTRDSIDYRSHISLPVKDFYRLDIYEPDTKSDKKSKAKGIIGISVITAGIITIIAGVALVERDLNNYYSSEGCSPQVYAFDSDKSQLAGILYSGAIFAPLQRTDYMPLSGINPVNGKFHLQIRGGKNEELIIHDTKLLQVTHDKGNNVLMDRHGKVLVYRQPVKPKKVSIGENQDIGKDVSDIDENYYSFTNQSTANNTSDIILDFKKPAGVHSGKLVIRAKNSRWAAYLFKKFKSLYGDYYPAMVQQKDKADRNKLIQCELDQSLPLSVSVKEGDGWKFIDYFFTPGSQVQRDMIMEINLVDSKNTDHLQIKLETTYMFWDLDYAGMDFSGDLPCKTTYLPPTNVSKSDSTSRLSELYPTHHNTHLTDKEHLNIDFAVKSATGNNSISSYFLVGNGYYHDNTRFEGKPQLSRLATFSQKGAFDKFSRETFEEWVALIKNKDVNRLAANK